MPVPNLYKSGSHVVGYAATAVCAGIVVLRLAYPWMTFDVIEPIVVMVLCGVFVVEAGSGRWRWLAGTLSRWRFAGPPLLLIFTVVLNLSVLAESWHKGIGHPCFTIGGLVPYSDASGYCVGAKHLIEFGELDEWTSLRRPLGTCWYVPLMALTGQNVTATILLSIFLVAVSIFFAARAVWIVAGPSAAFMMATTVSYFYAPLNGAFLTESPGLFFGCLGFSLLLRGCAGASMWIFGAGAGVLSLALSARAGAFFALPLVVCVAGIVFGSRRRFRWSAPAACLAALAIAFALAGATSRMVIGKEYRTGKSNVFYSLYGMAAGGKGWTFVLQDHPELNGLSEVERSSRVRTLAIEKFRKSPGVVVHVIVTTLRANALHWFGFMEPLRPPLPTLALLGAFLFVIPLPFLPLSRPLRAAALLVIAVSPGILLSSPLLFDGGQRVYAATIPLQCAWIALGFGGLAVFARKALSGGATEVIPGAVAGGWGEGAFILAGVCGILLGPLIVKATHPLDPPKVWGERPDSCTIVFRASAGSHICIVGEEEGGMLPAVRESAYRIDNPSRFMGNPVFADVPRGASLTGVMDLCSGDWRFILFEEDIGALRHGYVKADLKRLGGNLYHDLYLGAIRERLERLPDPCPDPRK